MTQFDAAPAPAQETAACEGCGTDRRGLLRGAAAVGVAGVAGLALAACSSSSGSTNAASGPTTLGPTSDVPVGGGKVYKDEKVVVTQPTSGRFKAFSAVCTHAGCLVDGVQDGTIQCPCHGSQFKIADGSVANGPATSALPARTVAVQNGKLVVTA
ncbi:Rieske (2Fe-2S) protein [Streptacidiphilus carbonis]|uniref:Rieske (2Fe-2S) protein n=1 Tax=Streptacidiphilus carbonis TaxID=105422 RepID=UPI000A02203D|nr:Rieske (2Fe-2S) protein [Streptacidiphilus carbonis]